MLLRLLPLTVTVLAAAELTRYVRLVSGASPRAALFAVYAFLETYLGCGWIAPGDDAIPHTPTIRLPTAATVDAPAFSYRAISLFPYAEAQLNDRLRSLALFPYAGMQATIDRIDWAAKNRLNYVHPCVNERGPKLWNAVRSRELIVPEIVKRGLGLHYGGHSYFAWLPPEDYLATHPDFYSAFDKGKPQSLNLANPPSPPSNAPLSASAPPAVTSAPSLITLTPLTPAISPRSVSG